MSTQCPMGERDLTTFRRLAIVLCCVVFLALLVTRRAAEVSRKPARYQSSGVDTPVVAIDAHDGLYVNARPTRPEDLLRRVRQTIANLRDKRVYLRADKMARSATVLDTLEELRAAGIEVSLITRNEAIPIPAR